MKKTKKKVKKLSNRLHFTILSVIILILAGVVVYAYGTTNPLNFGHTFGELEAPSACTSSDEVLAWDGTAWTCVPLPPGTTTGDNPIVVTPATCASDQILQWTGTAWTCVAMPSGAGVSTFTGLTDTPLSFVANKYLRVNSGGSALEFVDVSPGGDTTCATSGTCSQVCIGTTCKTQWPAAGASLWSQSGSDIYYTGDIQVKGNDIYSNVFWADNVKVKLSMDVKPGSAFCVWQTGCRGPNVAELDAAIAALTCDSGEVSGDTMYVDLGVYCNQKTQALCEETPTYTLYRSCLDVQILS